jgi:hypothetical protein
MDVSQFGLFDMTCDPPRRIEGPDNRVGARRIANDNQKGATLRSGPRPTPPQRPMPGPGRRLFRFLPHRGPEPGTA